MSVTAARKREISQMRRLGITIPAEVARRAPQPAPVIDYQVKSTARYRKAKALGWRGLAAPYRVAPYLHCVINTRGDVEMFW